jgi:hypothetical protein
LDRAPKGSVVRVSSMSFSLRSTTDAMMRAYRRGVRVRVVIPAREWRGKQPRRLSEVIGSDITSPSYVTRCAGACLGPTSTTDGIAHSKMFLFSETSGRRYVTVYTSLNLSPAQSELRYNDAYTVVGDKAVFGASARYFDALRHDRPRAFDKRVRLEDYNLFFFPNAGRASQGFYRDLFSRTTCKGVTGSGEGGRTAVRFSTSRWRSDMLPLAIEMAELDAEGCRLRVLVNIEETDPDVIHALKAGGVDTRYIRSKTAPHIHSKFIAISGLHGGREVNTVYTGSLNPTAQALERSDNNMIHIKNDLEIFQAYQARFDQIWEVGASLASYTEVDKPFLTDADERRE